MEGAISNSTDKRIALVTGGNKGIGLEICKQLASHGIMVILTARDEKRGIEAVEKIKTCGQSVDIVFHQLDIADSCSIACTSDFVKTQFGKLDILVNNAAYAGTVFDMDMPRPTEEEFEGKDMMERIELLLQNTTEPYEKAEECLTINYYGTKQIIEVFMPLLQSSSSGNIVNVSSNGGLLRHFSSKELKRELTDIDNLTEKRLDELVDLFLKDFKDGLLEAHGWTTRGFKAYRVSKALLNAYTRILSKRYPTLRINCVHPGFVKTDMTMHSGILTTEEGADGPVMVALLPEGGPTGAYFDRTQVASFV